MTVHPRDLRRENVELRHKLDSLLAEIERRDEPLPCDFTTSEEIIARVLRSRSPRVVSREALHTALYAFRSEGEEPHLQVVDVLLSHVRKRLKAAGIAISNEWGRGWFMSVEAAAQWDRVAQGRKVR